MLPGSFEVQNRIDDMLECFRSRKRTIFCDVANQKNGDFVFLTPKQQPRRNLTHLTNAAGCHFELFTKSRLHRVDNYNPRTKIFSRSKYLFDRHLGVNMKTIRAELQALASHFDLLCGFFTGGIQDSSRRGQVAGDVQHEGRLAHSWITTKQHQRTGNDPSTQDPIEFLNAGRNACRFDARYRVEEHWR